LSFVVSQEVFLKNPKKAEGFLSKKRAFIVSRKNLNTIGEKLIDKSKIKSKMRTIPPNLYGNILEALIGAIYIDRGLEESKRFIKNNIINTTLYLEKEATDHKGDLKRKALKNNQRLEYKLIDTKGPDHNKEFTVAVYLDKQKLTQEKGRSIKEAEQKSAAKALKIVFLP
jgi:ribonuclease-3